MDSRTRQLGNVIRIVIAIALGAAIVLAIARSGAPQAASDVNRGPFKVTLTATERQSGHR